MARNVRRNPGVGRIWMVVGSFFDLPVNFVIAAGPGVEYPDYRDDR